ncbi:hypothetical protein [Kocuria varians]|uniref:hypothetical protein n=1 Tax=Kocuria varians TaxID=1272 RepID=UPI001F4281F3|nr:hypothetical protein [Kocuria varians]
MTDGSRRTPHSLHPSPSRPAATIAPGAAAIGVGTGRSDEPTRELPSTDEARVLLTGLGPLPAAVALALADAGVCLLNVTDPARVRVSDIHDGPYPAESEGLPRELALRSLLRRRSPRCAPISAPDLFPSAAVRGAVVLHGWTVAGELLDDLQEPPAPDVDPRMPTLTVLADGPCVLRWPLTDSAHRPCARCVADAARRARAIARGHPLVTGAPPLSERAEPIRRVTHAVAAGEITGLVLSTALGLDDDAATGSHAGPVARHGLRRIPLPPAPDCLCSLAFAKP